MVLIKSILVPVDGSESSERSVKTAAELAAGIGASIRLLYVANINQLAINACISDAVIESVKKAGDLILGRASELVPSGVESTTASEIGSPATVIADFANKNEVDLIVMGSRGLGLVQGVLLGSVSQYVLEHAKCPVLVVK